MMQKIQIKRGNKKDLPKLNLGEPAFTMDTKELFVGNGNKNQQMQTRENLIVNGNFQVVGEKFDIATDKITISPGTSRYIYGNFYISNASTSTGNITISRPDNGFITIESTNAQMSLEYRERLAEYLSIPALTYANIRPLYNQNLTLSFDYINTGNVLNFSSGSAVGALNNIVIPNGTGNIANVFTMQYAILGNGHFTRINLLNTGKPSSYTITIGNIKLEQGDYRTQFVPNPMYADILAIEQVYKVYDAAIRCLNENIGDLFNFNFPLFIPLCFRSTIPNIRINTAEIYSYDGIKQTGFTVTSSYQNEYNCATFQAKKTKNLLKEVYLITNFTVDLRPY